MKGSAVDLARMKEDFVRLNGKRGTVVGRYHAIERPMRGVGQTPRPRDHARLTLSDKAHVYLEAFDSPASQRPDEELRKFDRKLVLVTGTLFKVMPARAESPIAPCVADITEIREADEDEPGLNDGDDA